KLVVDDVGVVASHELPSGGRDDGNVDVRPGEGADGVPRLPNRHNLEFRAALDRAAQGRGAYEPPEARPGWKRLGLEGLARRSFSPLLDNARPMSGTHSTSSPRLARFMLACPSNQGPVLGPLLARPEEKPEYQAMQDEQWWHHSRWNEERGAELPGVELDPEQ